MTMRACTCTRGAPEPTFLKRILCREALEFLFLRHPGRGAPIPSHPSHRIHPIPFLTS